jgi:hypothetical protein
MYPLLLFFFASVTFHSDFEAGSIGRIETVTSGHYRCHVRGEVDQDKRNRQANWYYFRIDGARGVPLILDLVDLPGEYNYRPNRGAIIAETLPWYSEDQRTWKLVERAEFDNSVPMMRMRLRPGSDRVWVAHQPPYTTADLAHLIAEVRSNPSFSVRTAGKTSGGRDIPLITITDPSGDDRSRKVIWLLFRQHSWESGSSWAAEGAIRFLVSDSSKAAALRRTVVFKFFPMCDPDGVARGGVRFNVNGFDLNRNWDVADPVKMPEIAAQRNAILDWADSGRRIDLLVTLHNDEKNEYIEGPPGDEHAALMRRFEAALSKSAVFSATKPAALSAISTTPGKPGRMTFYQGLYRDRMLPAFLIEQMVVRHPKLGRPPGVKDREKFGRDLVYATAAATRTGLSSDAQ